MKKINYDTNVRAVFDAVLAYHSGQAESVFFRRDGEAFVKMEAARETVGAIISKMSAQDKKQATADMNERYKALMGAMFFHSKEREED